MRALITILFFLVVTNVCTQSKRVLFFENNELTESIPFKDSLELEKLKHQKKLSLTLEGYYKNYISRTVKTDSVFKIYLNLGKKYYWGDIKSDKILPSFETKNSKSNHTDIRKYFEKQLVYFENNGYPFAEIKMDSITLINDSLLTGKIKINKNKLYKIDTIVIKGNTKTAIATIYHILDLYPGMIYNESLIRSTKNKLEQCGFLEFIRYPEVSFTPNGNCMLTIFVNDKSNNLFDGIAGLNPDENTGKIILTGDLNLELNNVFKRAENISLSWRKTKVNTQNFNVETTIPYIFNTKFGIEGKLHSYREDTNFNRLNTRVGVIYNSSFNKKLSVYIASILNNNLAQNQTIAYPSYNSSRVMLYGVSYTQNSLNNTLNPSKGFSIEASTDFGNKRLDINNENTNETYNNLKANTSFYQLLGHFKIFIPIKNKSTLLLGFKGGAIINDQIFENELYQIGGLNSLRGFNEQSIAASSYSVGTLEYRFLVDRLSSFFVFADAAYIEQNTQNFTSDTPYGFGAGINLGSKAGVFSLAYALGSQRGNPILFKNGKVHFGYTSTF